MIKSDKIQLEAVLTFSKKDSKRKQQTRVQKPKEGSQSNQTLSLEPHCVGQNKNGKKQQPSQWSLNWDHSSIHSQKSNFNSPGFSQDASPDPSFLSINSLAARTEELQSIESIQNEGYVRVFERPSETSNGHYAVYIQPQNTQQEENFCWVILEVAYSKTYPLAMPDKLLLQTDQSSYFQALKTKFGRAISNSDLKEMNDKVMHMAKSLIEQRSVVVYDIIEHVREALFQINAETSIYQRRKDNDFKKVIQKQLSGVP